MSYKFKPKLAKCRLCSPEEPEKPIMAKGLCEYHYKQECAKRYQEKRKKKLSESAKALKKKVFKKKFPTDKYILEKKSERAAMLKFWNSQADELGNCYCEECLLLNIGSSHSRQIASLGSEFNPYNVAHIISKGANKKYQADTRNFILLCANHHNQFDGQFEGKTRGDMKIFPQTEAIRLKLKKEDKL